MSTPLSPQEALISARIRGLPELRAELRVLSVNRSLALAGLYGAVLGFSLTPAGETMDAVASLAGRVAGQYPAGPSAWAPDARPYTPDPDQEADLALLLARTGDTLTGRLGQDGALAVGLVLVGTALLARGAPRNATTLEAASRVVELAHRRNR